MSALLFFNPARCSFRCTVSQKVHTIDFMNTNPPCTLLTFLLFRDRAKNNGCCRYITRGTLECEWDAGGSDLAGFVPVYSKYLNVAACTGKRAVTIPLFYEVFTWGTFCASPQPHSSLASHETKKAIRVGSIRYSHNFFYVGATGYLRDIPFWCQHDKQHE
jgi:hypothetical protein